ncbi:hypothetical protein LTR66_017805 [Elasticomyces elasticus]|nr:hypothetical protein LTR66_017805 [Elasticomyces elasticus]
MSASSMITTQACNTTTSIFTGCSGTTTAETASYCAARTWNTGEINSLLSYYARQLPQIPFLTTAQSALPSSIMNSANSWRDSMSIAASMSSGFALSVSQASVASASSASAASASYALKTPTTTIVTPPSTAGISSPPFPTLTGTATYSFPPTTTSADPAATSEAIKAARVAAFDTRPGQDFSGHSWGKTICAADLKNVIHESWPDNSDWLYYQWLATDLKARQGAFCNWIKFASLSGDHHYDADLGWFYTIGKDSHGKSLAQAEHNVTWSVHCDVSRWTSGDKYPKDKRTPTVPHDFPENGKIDWQKYDVNDFQAPFDRITADCTLLSSGDLGYSMGGWYIGNGITWGLNVPQLSSTHFWPLMGDGTNNLDSI